LRAIAHLLHNMHGLHDVRSRVYGLNDGAGTARSVGIGTPAALVAQGALRPHELASLLECLCQRNRLTFNQIDVGDEYIPPWRGLEALAQPEIRALGAPQFALAARQLGLACGPLRVDLGQLLGDRRATLKLHPAVKLPNQTHAVAGLE